MIEIPGWHSAENPKSIVAPVESTAQYRTASSHPERDAVAAKRFFRKPCRLPVIPGRAWPRWTAARFTRRWSRSWSGSGNWDADAAVAVEPARI